MKDVSVLFKAFESKKLNLKNRIVMAPMTRNKSPGYVTNDEVVAYYRRRAESEVGLIITEATTINHPSAAGYADVPAFHGEGLDGWKKVVDAVHAAGGKIAPQLWHVGTIRKPGVGPYPEAPAMGPSGLLFPGKKRGEAMTQSDIDATIKAYADAAADAKRLGFDAVEIHGAHGYLIDQFFWEGLNERTDKYGGSLEKRSQFAIEIIEATRSQVGPDFPIIFRFSQWKQQNYTVKLAQNPAELERFLLPLVKAGVDIFHASSRRFWEPEFDGSTLNLAGWTKKITGLPTISVGSVGLETDFIESNYINQETGKDFSIRNIDDLVERMEAEEFDLIAVGRALLQDPYWVVKVKSAQWSEIQPYSKAAVDVLF